MNEELLKQLLKLKFSFAHKMVERLPDLVQKPVKDLETEMIRALYDVSKDYVEKGSNSDTAQAGRLKPIERESPQAQTVPSLLTAKLW